MCSRGVFFNFLGEVVCEKNCQAVPMLMKAIECRVRERELFQSMRCQVACDMRIIGRDRENRPVIYLSARSQSEHLRELIPHVFLAFEVPTKKATKKHPFFFWRGQRSWTFYVMVCFQGTKKMRKLHQIFFLILSAPPLSEVPINDPNFRGGLMA